MRSWRTARWVLVVAAAAAAAGAETPRADEVQPVGGLGFRDQVEVTVVNVDVFVRDRDGNAVTDLRQDDFKVFQNGVEMPITNFAVLTDEIVRSTVAVGGTPTGAPPPPPSEIETPAAVVKPAWVVLFVDNENLHPHHRARVLRRVREFVVESLHEPVRMMVVSSTPSLKVVQAFTTDSREVNAALDGMKRLAGGRVERDNARRELVDRIEDVANQDYGAGARNTRDGSRLGIEQQIMAYAEEEANSLSFTLSALHQVISMMSGLDGSKSIVHVSSGLAMTPGIGLMHQYATTFHDTSILSRRSRVDRMSAYRSVGTVANAQDVRLYTIDASGLNPLEGFSAEDRYGMDPTASSIGMDDLQASLLYLAEATGGLAVVNTNDIGPGLGRIRDDLFSYYSLGYSLKSSGEDRVHEIKVELASHPEYDLRYRRRFVEKSLEGSVQDRVLSSLMVEFDDNPMELEMASGAPAPVSQDRWTVPFHLSFPLERIALLPSGDDYVGQIVLFVGARDDDGRSSEIQRQEHEIRVPLEAWEEARGQRFGIDLRLLLEEGTHRVVVGVLDRLTRQASYEGIGLTVP